MSTTAANTVGWFEVGAPDVAAAKDFYGPLFGWTFAPDGDYTLITAPGADGPSGGIFNTGGNLPPYAVFVVRFTDVAATALRGLTHYTVSDEQVAEVMPGWDELPAFPDVLPAVRRLTEAGLRVACLTNGSAAAGSALANRAGFGGLVDRVISAEEVYRWKPAGVVYLYAASVMNVPADRMALVTAHDWDCHGGKRAGLTTGWVSRKAGGFGAPFAPPDVVGEDLTEVAAQLLALEP